MGGMISVENFTVRLFNVFTIPLFFSVSYISLMFLVIWDIDLNII